METGVTQRALGLVRAIENLAITVVLDSAAAQPLSPQVAEEKAKLWAVLSIVHRCVFPLLFFLSFLLSNPNPARSACLLLERH